MKAAFLAHVLPACGAFGLDVAEDQADLMWRHFSRLLRANQQMNLTRITDPAQAAVKQQGMQTGS